MGKSILFFALVPVISLIVLFNNNNVVKDVKVYKNDYKKPIEEPKCSDCHTDLLANKTKHSPATESCETCHQVNVKDHSENGTKGLNLIEKVPELCYMCHEGIKNVVDSSKNVHKIIMNGKSCASCHSPHSSNENKLLVLDEKKLCLSCHNKDVNAEGKKLMNIDKILSTSKTIHPPIESGCIVCHNPHASNNNYQLIKAFPKGQYAKGETNTFELCWECHDAGLLNDSKTTSATNFRNGDKNLHFVHLNGEKGRTCVMCHNIHGSTNEHLIVDKVQFGEWNLPIRFVAKDNGGSCFPGCHSKKEYTY